MSGGIVGEPTTGDMEDACDTLLWLRSWSTDYRGPLIIQAAGDWMHGWRGRWFDLWRDDLLSAAEAQQIEIDTRMCSTCGFTAYIDDCWCDREQCEHTEWVPEIESWVRCTANTLMHTPDTRVLCPAHCGCGNIDLGESGAA